MFLTREPNIYEGNRIEHVLCSSIRIHLVSVSNLLVKCGCVVFCFPSIVLNLRHSKAMALVHSRISRVIHGVPRINGGGFGGGILHGITSNSNDGNIGEPPVYIHNLPGINHHYRVFCCNPNSDLYKECRKLHPF